jgi:hypothetical protein
MLTSLKVLNKQQGTAGMRVDTERQQQQKNGNIPVGNNPSLSGFDFDVGSRIFLPQKVRSKFNLSRG